MRTHRMLGVAAIALLLTSFSSAQVVDETPGGTIGSAGPISPVPCAEVSIVCTVTVPFCNGTQTVTYSCQGCDPACGGSPPSSPCVYSYMPTCARGKVGVVINIE